MRTRMPSALAPARDEDLEGLVIVDVHAGARQDFERRRVDLRALLFAHPGIVRAGCAETMSRDHFCLLGHCGLLDDGS